MYLGHLGVGLAAKGYRRSVPLWLLLTASLGPDWIAMPFRFLGESDQSLLSHGFPGSVIGCIAFTLLAYRVTRSRKDALLVALVFASHIPLDLLTGEKPYWQNGIRLGLGWYHRALWDFAAEGALLTVGWLSYRRSLLASSRRHPVVYLLIAVLLIWQACFDRFLGEGNFKLLEKSRTYRRLFQKS